MNLQCGSGYNHLYDFHTLKIGHKFDSEIDTDINGNSGFVLDWKPGDIILFKEFGGEFFDETPSVPLDGYSLKAKITNEWPKRPTDEPNELFQNVDLTIPNYNGNKPQGLAWSSPDITYIPGLSRIECTNVAANAKITSTTAPGFGTGNVYTVSMTVSDHTAGRVTVRLFGSSTEYWSDGWRDPSGAGLHTYTWTVDTSITAFGPWGGSYYID